MTKLVTALQSREFNNSTSKTTTDHDPICTDPPIIDLTTNLIQVTKNTKDEFYNLYGTLKNCNIHFTKEQLNSRFTKHYIDSFRDRRTKLTNWMKMGLALSQQLAEWQKPHPVTDDYYPLLTIRSMSVSCREEYSNYLHTAETLRQSLQEKIILEASQCLQILNLETRNILDNSTVVFNSGKRPWSVAELTILKAASRQRQHRYFSTKFAVLKPCTLV